MSGHITSDTTWSGTQAIQGTVTVDAGVTLTIAAGTVVTGDGTASLTIDGTVDIEGTSAGNVMIQPGSGAASFGTVMVDATGTLVMKYAVVTGTAIITLSGSNTTVRDSHLWNSPHDLLTMSGGTLDMQYSWIGVQTSPTKTSHCDIHFGGSGDMITVSHSTLSTAYYGVMFYDGTNADFTYDNWYGNDTNVDATLGSVTGDFSNSYFENNQTPPTATGITETNLANSMLASCDGTNDTVCAGPHP